MATPHDFPVLPETSVEVIEASSFKQEIFDRLCSGWSPPRVSAWLGDTYNEEISPAAINRFFGEIPTIYVLPPTLVKSRLAMLDVQIDSVTELGRVLRMQEERLAAHHLLEELTGGGPETLRKLGPPYRKDLRLYFSMLVDYTKLMQSLGVFSTEPQKFDVALKEKLPTLGELLQAEAEAEAEGTTADGA